MKLKRQKCAFCLPQVEYLRHIISAEGLCPAASTVKAIKEAPKPSALFKFKSFLGFVNYYTKFLSDSATILATLQVTDKYLTMEVGQRTTGSI